MIADGYVGRVLGTTVVGSGAAWGGETQRRQAYLFDDFFYRGSGSRGDNFRWEINGTEGDLVLTAPTGTTDRFGPDSAANGRRIALA